MTWSSTQKNGHNVRKLVPSVCLEHTTFSIPMRCSTRWAKTEKLYMYFLSDFVIKIFNFWKPFFLNCVFIPNCSGVSTHMARTRNRSCHEFFLTFFSKIFANFVFHPIVLDSFLMMKTFFFAAHCTSNWCPEKDSSLLLCQVKTGFYHWTIGTKEFLCQGQDSDELQTQNWWTFPVAPIHPPLHLEGLPIGQVVLLGQIFWLVSACEC